MNLNSFSHTYSNTSQNHPLQHNSQNYLLYNKYVSIHSEDRDILAYPNSSEFEIELPEDILNISTMKLFSWTFPSNYNTFSKLNSNITMFFKFINPYHPAANGEQDLLQNAIANALNYYNDSTNYPKDTKDIGYYKIIIEEGFYNPTQFTTELTNKFNDAVTKVVTKYMIDNNLFSELNEFQKTGGYTRFIIVYNNVSQKIWFGNQCDSFELLNEMIFLSNRVDNFICKRNQLPDFSNWGLPSNVGLERTNVNSIEPVDVKTSNYIRFYYGDVVKPNDNGYWLTPPVDNNGVPLKNAIVQYIECPYKINIFGPSHFYMEIQKYNSIDETEPYNVNNFTLTTNETNGIVNSAFAKIPIISTPLTQYYDGPSNAYKFFNPPIERIRRLKFKLRYHNGTLVDFSTFPYSFTIEFTTLLPMINRSVKFVDNI
uniref:Uncharacterized protein n=1 Tax=viral metagenome TaxID=1070528 RepID=A0A6C0DIS3_9ZZZZ